MKHLGIEHPRRPVCCKFGSVLYLLGSHWFSPFEDLDVQRKFLSRWRICSEKSGCFWKKISMWSNIMRSQNNPAKPTLSRVLPFGNLFPFSEQEGGDVAVLFLEFQRDKPEQPSQLVQQDVWWQASHQPRGETPCRHCWLAEDACLYWSSKVTAEKTTRAHPIKHLYLSCKPALRFGLDRKCCYGLRRVGGGHWWRQRRSGQQNHEMNALPRSDGSKLPFFRLEACTNRDHCAPRQFAQRILFDASLQLNDVSLWAFWIHNWYWTVWQQDCQLCRALARCFNNCITSVSLTTVWTRLLQVQSRATIFRENHVMGGSVFLGMWLKSCLHLWRVATAIRRHEENSSHAPR